MCKSDHLSAVQPLLSVFVGISISSDFLPACTVHLCVSLGMYLCEFLLAGAFGVDLLRAQENTTVFLNALIGCGAV